MDGLTASASRDTNLVDNNLDALNSLEPEPITLVLFGAAGDLSKRKVSPALYNLFLCRKICK